MKEDYDNIKEEGSRDSISKKIIKMLAEVTEISEYTNAQISEKLLPILISDDAPLKNAEIVPKAMEEFPPLFNEIRSYLIDIRKNLQSIQKVIDRAAI